MWKKEIFCLDCKHSDVNNENRQDGRWAQPYAHKRLKNKMLLLFFLYQCLLATPISWDEEPVKWQRKAWSYPRCLTWGRVFRCPSVGPCLTHENPQKAMLLFACNHLHYPTHHRSLPSGNYLRRAFNSFFTLPCSFIDKHRKKCYGGFAEGG